MILYFGNDLVKHGFTPTTIVTLTPLLSEKFKIVKSSDKKSQLLRLLDMVRCFLKFRTKSKAVLIDTYSRKAYWYAFVIGALSFLFSKPYILILHSGDLPEHFAKNKQKYGFLLKRAFKIVSPSRFIVNFLSERGFEVFHIPNFVYLPTSDLNLNTQLNLNIPILFWVRSLHEIYQPMMAIKLVEKLKEDFPEIKLYMVGPDKQDWHKRIGRALDENNLTQNVILTGKLPQAEWLNMASNADVFINTSSFDNNPVSIMEALSVGLPVVSTNVGGIGEIVDDGVNGYLVGVDDVDEMALKTKHLLSDKELRRKFSTNAIVKSREFDWENIQEKWFKILHQAIS